jgi:mono/diheme cytochrome c family protein
MTRRPPPSRFGPAFVRVAGVAVVVVASSASGCRGREARAVDGTVDAGAVDPCATYVGPAHLGVVDAAVDQATAARLRAWREARLDERARDELSPADRARRLVLDEAHIAGGCVALDDVVDVGRALFLRTTTTADGFGHGGDDDARAAQATTRVQRGVFGGPDARSCVDCHWQGGDGGGGDRSDNSYVLGDGVDVDSADARNPPALFGAGWVELAAREISADLARQRAALVTEVRTTRAPAARTLASEGITFGTLRARPGDDGDVVVDDSDVEGVDADLIVRPFGNKGTVADLRTFIGRSLQLHLGLQSDEWVHARAARHGDDVGGVDDGAGVDLTTPGGNDDDPDGDGVTHEVSAGQLTALVLFVATLDAPEQRPLEEAPERVPELFSNELSFVRSPEYTARFARGYALFGRTGCASCHLPFVRVHDPRYTTASLSPRGRPVVVDLARDGAQPAPARDDDGAYLLPVFSDFKRHDMGPALAGRKTEAGVGPSVWLTRRLWAMSQTAPYTHAGSAVTVDEAVALHGGEAAVAARNFALLDESERVDLRLFLSTLARAPALRVR